MATIPPTLTLAKTVFAFSQLDCGNRDRDLRLQYLAGLGLNEHSGDEIYREMLDYRTYPDDLFVSRENRLSVGDQIDELRTAMTGDQPVTIFPEGTTHDGSGLLPFKAALFAALVPPPTGMMVQPVFLTYGRHTARMSWVGEEGIVENFWRVMSYLKPITATLHFLDPFDPAQYPDRKAISAEVRSRIAYAMQSGDHSRAHV